MSTIVRLNVLDDLVTWRDFYASGRDWYIPKGVEVQPIQHRSDARIELDPEALPARMKRDWFVPEGSWVMWLKINRFQDLRYFANLFLSFPPEAGFHPIRGVFLNHNKIERHLRNGLYESLWGHVCAAYPKDFLKAINE